MAQGEDNGHWKVGLMNRADRVCHMGGWKKKYIYELELPVVEIDMVLIYELLFTYLL